MKKKSRKSKQNGSLSQCSPSEFLCGRACACEIHSESVRKCFLAYKKSKKKNKVIKKFLTVSSSRSLTNHFFFVPHSSIFVILGHKCLESKLPKKNLPLILKEKPSGDTINAPKGLIAVLSHPVLSKRL